MLRKFLSKIDNFIKNEIHSYYHFKDEKLISFHKEKEDNHQRLVCRYTTNKSQINWETIFPSQFLHAKIHLNDEKLQFSVGNPLYATWLSFENKLIYKLFDKFGDREIGIHYYDGLLYWHLLSDPDNWSDSVPKWRDYSINIKRLIEGKKEHTSELLEEKSIKLCLFEKDYFGTGKLFSNSAKDRWGRIKKSLIVELSFPNGIPIPGKGENGWDCEEDAIYQFNYPASSIDVALEDAHQSVLNRRLKYGGKNWLPCDCVLH